MEIDLRDTRREDLDFVLALEQSPENGRFIGSWDYSQHLKALSDPDRKHFIVEESETERALGYIILCGVNSPHKSLELMRIVISEKGKGIGRICLELVKSYAFTFHEFNRLWLEVLSDNYRAKHLYESSGFTIEGTMRECFLVEGHLKSVNLLSMLKREYHMDWNRAVDSIMGKA